MQPTVGSAAIRHGKQREVIGARANCLDRLHLDAQFRPFDIDFQLVNNDGC
ncbi:hypothetical protein PQR02_34185 [Paraburkholderia sediminicola]|uniref:Uncharacterized protein n=1 Tax=Paraburkholderia rhynchosiae TaxID=487049 RepID=A0ACC7NNZ3_9BURK